ncbi:venom protease-like [Lycorma delicatula]|uniref:venom protease-like n=1 Tax=Lycorma delicatula TaxID=130591 RepID=UPI003F511C52
MAPEMFCITFIWIFFNFLIGSSILHSCTESNGIILQNVNCRCGQANDDVLMPRIVGGVQTKPHKYPWLTIILKDNKFHCGGSVINNKYILTAGHCVFDEKKQDITEIHRFIVVLGAYNRNYDDERSKQYFFVSAIKMPKLFHGDSLHDVHDVALIKLHKEITYNDAVSPVCLPQKIFRYEGVYGFISGWGTMSYKGKLSQFPREATIQVINDQKCMSIKTLGEHFAEDTLAMFCGYNIGTDACQGDSGGPMVVYEDRGFVQIGIVSWGIECALKYHPGIYTRLPHYLDWVYNNTQDAVYCS